jgi:protein-arginine deiminase
MRIQIGVAAGLVLLGGCGGEPALDPVGVEREAVVRWPTLLVDANRDGSIEARGDDLDHRSQWDSRFGASFLANVDDDDGDGRLDAEDQILNGADDAADLARVLVPAWTDAPSGTVAKIAIDRAAGAKVRLFRRDGTRWAPMSADGLVDEAAIRGGIELGVEGLDFASPQWDGMLTLTVEGRDGAGNVLGTDRATMRVAPLVLSNNTDETERILVTKVNLLPSSLDFVGDLDAVGSERGITFQHIDGLRPEYTGGGRAYDQWTQDFMEFGWSAIPGPGGRPQGMKVVLRTPTGRPASKVTLVELLGKDFGYAWKRTEPFSCFNHDCSMDSTGNLDALPPYTNGSSHYPLGRVLLGGTPERHPDPALHAFLDAQRVQGPVFDVDTAWLAVGHVDEFLSFVSAPGTRHGWKMLVASPRLARKMLQDWVATDPALAQAKMFQGMRTSETGSLVERTVRSVLNDPALLAFNQRAQAIIDGERDRIQAEVGLADDEIVEIPSLFEDVEGGSALAYMPGSVNMIVNERALMIPKMHTLAINGSDAFERDLVERLGFAGRPVRFIENWYLYHQQWGEVHCGTNPVRKMPTNVKWWEVGR